MTESQFQSGGMGVIGSEATLEVHRGSPKSALHIEIERRKEAEKHLIHMCKEYGNTVGAYEYFDRYPDAADG